MHSLVSGSRGNPPWIVRPLPAWPYLVWGLGLAAFKYGVEVAVIWGTSQVIYSPHEFLMPLLSVKASATSNCPSWVLAFILFWSYPFFVVALMLTARRCIDMGKSPWLALLLLIPLVNLVLMALFAVWPSAADKANPTLPDKIDCDPTSARNRWLQAILVSQLAGAIILGTSVLVLHEYGMALFFVAPMVIGVISGFLVSRDRPKLADSLAASLLSLAIGLGLVFAIGMEGAICLVMAAPLVGITALLGGWFGHVLAFSTFDKSYSSLAIVLPLVLLADATRSSRQIREVLTTREIDAPPKVVWNVVLEFPPLEEKPGGLFRWGVAYPIRARIEGSGVGAVRYCEFSTGAFVEPITAWNPPERLGFDVAQQPDPLTELSPYRGIHPPHLDGFLRSERGEFRLVRLPDGRTRLEGRTWYSIDMQPIHYWQVWCDQIIHSIHDRVLSHIEAVAERQMR